MTKHNKRRVAVIDNGEYVGVLEDIDLLSFIAGNSQMVAARIDRASSRDDLAAAAGAIESQVRMLRRQGVRIEVVAEIVSDLNRHLFAKLFAMTASPSIRERGCLIVMGSEGRGEQTMRTDQDNGLILAEPVDRSGSQGLPRRVFRRARALRLSALPGRSDGRQSRNGRSRSPTIAADFRGWLAEPDERAQMNIAIFYDAEAVAGDGELLRRAKQALIDAMRGERAHLARFARAVDAFPTPIGLFNNLVTSQGPRRRARSQEGRHFPDRPRRARAGARTRPRRDRHCGAHRPLAEEGALSHDLARELTQALRYLMTLRLDAQLAAAASGSLVRPGELSTMERDLLRDAFHVVKQLREVVRRHFNLAMF